MQSANYLMQLRHKKKPAIVLSAIFCFASAGSLAAGLGTAAAPTISNPSFNQGAASLKLDLGLAVSGDDCEDDYADLMRIAGASGGSVPSVKTPLPVSDNKTVFAKLAPEENFTPSATRAAALPPAIHTRTAPAEKPATHVVAVSAAPVAPVRFTAPAAPAALSWEIMPSDKTLNTTLARWAAAAGWQLVWELPVDYAVSVRTEIHGSFMEAVELVAKSMDTAEIPMKAIFYEGNHVLRIVAKGAE